jgi:uncharacterized protein
MLDYWPLTNDDRVSGKHGYRKKRGVVLQLVDQTLSEALEKAGSRGRVSDQVLSSGVQARWPSALQSSAIAKDRLVTLADYALLLFGAATGGFAAGLAGFGTALMALDIWLYVLPPSIAVPLVLINSVVAQSATLPSMWRSFNLTLVWPFVIGGLLGMPLGTMLVVHADPRIFKLIVGLLLLVFPIMLYFSTPMAIQVGGKFADSAIGFAGGILGGFAGLSGPLPILWASVRGWGKHERRGVFQTFNWIVLFAALCLHAAGGMVEFRVVWLAALTVPTTIIGTQLGTRLYHALSDRNFHDVVLALLFLSSAGLLWNGLASH